MPIPIICLDWALANYAAIYRRVLTKPQYQYLVTVLMASMLCQNARTLTSLVDSTAQDVSVCGLSRFFSSSPWSEADLAEIWTARFCTRMLFAVNKEHERQRQQAASGLQHRGRPKATVVTGYLIGDDSTMAKKKGKKMEGLGFHYSTTAGKTVNGHSLVQTLYSLLGCHCPQMPDMYRQESDCEAAGIPFQSKIDIMVERIRTFKPVPGTATCVLLDSWYCAKAIWKTARDRGFDIVCGAKSNRWLWCQLADKDEKSGWHKLSDYAASLKSEDYELMDWPGQEGHRKVYVHTVTTRVRKLSRSCQVLIARDKLDAPLSDVRYFVASDTKIDKTTFLEHIAARWDIEVFFGDAKELLGLDQYQLMTQTAILRFWTAAMAAYAYLEEVRIQLVQERGHHVTLGEARKEVQNIHYQHLIEWVISQSQHGETCQQLCAQLAI
jgi:SRSO17 transposase